MRSLPNRIQGEEAIYLYPRGHARAEWWHLNQYEHMVALLDWVKRTYNVDENRVYLTGISDGATGDYFFAMKLTTPFSAFLPLNGNMRVLATPSTRPNGQMYAGNLVNKPLFIVNGGRDPLYPVAAVAPHVEMIKAAGASRRVPPAARCRPRHQLVAEPNGSASQQFVAAHPRQPHPEAVSWESERTDRYNRAHWLVIDQLGRRPGDATGLDDVNRFSGRGRRAADVRPHLAVGPRGRAPDRQHLRRPHPGRHRLHTAAQSGRDRPRRARSIVRVNGDSRLRRRHDREPRTLLEWHAGTTTGPCSTRRRCRSGALTVSDASDSS